MKNDRFVRVMGSVMFFVLLFIAIGLTSRVLEYKVSGKRIKPYLKDAKSYDVVFLGNSHAIYGIYPLELWRDYGIASYNLSSFGSTMAVNYWTARLMLETAQPKLVVIDVDEIAQGEKAPKSNGDLHIALDAYPLTATKISAIEDLMGNTEEINSDGNRYTDIRWEYYFKLAKYHDRFGELTADDLFPSREILRGAMMMIDVADPVDYDIIDERQAWDQGGWGYEYLRMLIELCQSRGIDVLLTHVPFPASEHSQEEANAVLHMLGEYGIQMIDMVNIDGIADYQVDSYDQVSHLNPSGARKVTDFLGEYIISHYNIPDHRGEAEYAVWDADYDAYMDDKLAILREENDLKTFLMLLHDSDFSAMISMKAGSAVYQEEKLLTLMQNIGREHIYFADAYYAWSSAMQPLAQLPRAAAYGVPCFLLFDRKNGEIQERAGIGEDTIQTSFGAVTYRSDEEGASVFLNSECLFEAQAEARDIRIVIVDDRTGEVALVTGFDIE